MGCLDVRGSAFFQAGQPATHLRWTCGREKVLGCLDVECGQSFQTGEQAHLCRASGRDSITREIRQ